MTRIPVSDGVVVEQVATASLGDHTYVIVIGDQAAVVDPQRDVDRFTDVTARLEAAPVVVVETHVHNDYVSGGSLLADGHGCRYVLPAGSGATLRHHAVDDGELVPVAEGWVLRAVHTPGHTPHHMSYVLRGPHGDVAAFTGGSMLVGSVGRTDLIAAERTEELTRAQYRSVRRLAADLADPVAVAPTHGAGSFCAATPSLATSSTIGVERRQNPALTTPDEDTFVTAQMSGFGLYPAYYRHMAPINRVGIGPIDPPPPVLGADELAATAATVVDLRPAESFAAGHVPRSLNVPASPTAATYIAWVHEWNDDIVLVATTEKEVEEIRLDLSRIGFDAVIGIVTDGLAAWQSSGGVMATTRLATFDDLLAEGADVLIDARDPAEVDRVLPDAIRTHLSQLDATDLEDGTVWVHCRTGYRAAIAASVLEAAGRSAVAIVDDLDRFTGPTVPA